MPITYGEITNQGYNFAAIVKAIERLILMRSPVLPNRYDANFHGIVDALWDLGQVLQGQVPPLAGANFGPYPPGWNTATQSYNQGQQPGDGSWWFDTRQGRLFIAEGGEWFQANGAESFVHINAQPPARLATGALWLCALDGRLYVYANELSATGAAGWYEVSGGGGGVTALHVLTDVIDDPPVGGIPAVDFLPAVNGGDSQLHN
jgi:hypothetical protein